MYLILLVVEGQPNSSPVSPQITPPTVQPVAPQPPVMPAQPMPPQRSRFLPILLAVIFAGAVFGAGGYLYAKYSDKKTQDETMVTPIVTAAPTETEIARATPTDAMSTSGVDTTTWKIFSSDTLKLSFKYPDDWIAEICSGNGPPLQCFHTANYQAVTVSVPPGEGGMSSVLTDNVGEQLTISASASDQNFDMSLYCGPGGPSSVANCEERQVGQYTFAFRELGSAPYPASASEADLIYNGKDVAEFMFYFSQANKANDLQIYNAILSSVSLL